MSYLRKVGIGLATFGVACGVGLLLNVASGADFAVASGVLVANLLVGSVIATGSDNGN